MTIKEHLEVLLAPLLEKGDCYLVDIINKPSKLSQKITILVDSDQGITIQQCTSISRQLAKQLEELDLITEAYTLEVSSPGLDHPLILPRQYTKNIGRNLKVTLKTGEVITGKLTEVTEQDITIELPLPKKKAKVPVEPGEMVRNIVLSDISKALVEISFK
ncbi:ribosome maturation factor RimP [Dyadobacter sp.]|uniref:ribosome maturation factor RimP n=1 Tax=Dyadobacter sp. TaxID=1914288 RepID=UPI003F70082D